MAPCMRNSADLLRPTGLSQILIVKRLLVTECIRREWLQRLKGGDFAVKDGESSGGEKSVEDAELEESNP
nr:hypothetical protein HmN_000603700 [Hymenolepis microstoma]